MSITKAKISFKSGVFVNALCKLLFYVVVDYAGLCDRFVLSLKPKLADACVRSYFSRPCQQKKTSCCSVWLNKLVTCKKRCLMKNLNAVVESSCI